LKNWLIEAALGAERDVSVAIGITMMQYRLKRGAAFELLRASRLNSVANWQF